MTDLSKPAVLNVNGLNFNLMEDGTYSTTVFGVTYAADPAAVESTLFELNATDNEKRQAKAHGGTRLHDRTLTDDVKLTKEGYRY